MGPPEHPSQSSPFSLLSALICVHLWINSYSYFNLSPFIGVQFLLDAFASVTPRWWRPLGRRADHRGWGAGAEPEPMVPALKTRPPSGRGQSIISPPWSV